LRQSLTIDQYPAWPDAFFLEWTFENRGGIPLKVHQLAAPRLELGEGLRGELWTLQGPAVDWGQDFAFPLPASFHRDNFLGHNDNGEGGGIPVLYAWNQQVGLALAHVETHQAHWFMPVTSSEQVVSMALEDRQSVEIAPGQRFHSLRVLVSRHRGDFFAPLSLYRQVMAQQGLAAPPANPENYQPAWCSWGYEFDVRPEEMLGVLPVLQDLGIRWLTLDDRWFDHYGDWNPRLDTFPGGEDQIRQIVADIHRAGAFAQIWWYPLCVEDGVGGWEGRAYNTSVLLEEGLDWLLLNQDGSPARNNRGLAILCPAVPDVQAYTQALVQRFIQDWGFDGHKLDNIYTVPACYNPLHHHRQPEESLLGFAEVYRSIFETTRQLKPRSVTQICPCGTPITHTLIPYTDQTVTADPTSSLQIRQRIKFYKALMGTTAAVFADHVELSDGGVDFASEIGTGGVPGTKLIWPEDDALRQRLSAWWALTPQKRLHWKMWLEIYAQHRLAEGECLNLYDLAFDLPEAHAICKDNALYYAFYTPAADQTYRGEIVLRGLGDCPHQVRDYVRARSLGIVHGPVASLQVVFQGSLLLQAIPEK
jgi:alpha-galactosidase